MLKKFIVVTGAAGLIGSGVVRYLNDLGYGPQLVVVDDLYEPIKKRNLDKKIYYQKVGIQDLFSWLKGEESSIEAFIHLGACSDTLEKDQNFLSRMNTDYTKRLAEYALAGGHRFIYASSAATYGDGSQGFSDHHDLLPYLNPLNDYARSKHQFDLWAQKQGILNQIVGLKYFNVFGPNEFHKAHMSSVIFKLFQTIQNKQKVYLFRSLDKNKWPHGGQLRDFIYVKDAVKMTCSFLDNSHTGIFNIGTGEPISWNQVAQAVFNSLNLPAEIYYKAIPKKLRSQYQSYTCAEMKKYQSLMSVVQDYSFQQAVDDYIHNYLLVDAVW